MANYSDASGSIVWGDEVPPECGFEKFWEALDIVMGDVASIMVCDEREVLFGGNGRWTYEYSLEHLPESLEYIKKAGWHKEEIALLEDLEWEVMFDYYDVEHGNEFFYRGVTTVEHNRGDDIGKTNTVLVKDEDIPYDMFHYAATFAVTIEEVIEEWNLQPEEVRPRINDMLRNIHREENPYLYDAFRNYAEGVMRVG